MKAVSDYKNSASTRSIEITIDTKTISGRRSLEFDTLDDVLADAEILTTKQATTVGNWTLGQIFQHLANAMNLAIDGSDHRAPWYFRLIGPMILKSILKKGMSPGYQLSEPAASLLLPEDDLGTEAGLEALRQAIARMKTEDHREPHLAFGKMSREKWEKLHLRHAELHLSFAVI